MADPFFSAQENKCSRDGNPATPKLCGCDEAKAWEARALAAESRVRAIRVWLGGLLTRVDATLGALDGTEPEDVG